MNLVDSCGWLEFFGRGKNLGFFLPVIRNTDELIVPTICIYEVLKKAAQMVDEDEVREAGAVMKSGLVIDLDLGIAVSAARLSNLTKLPLADSIILATARAHDATIWTQDEHFRHIDGVRFCEG